MPNDCLCYCRSCSFIGTTVRLHIHYIHIHLLMLKQVKSFYLAAQKCMLRYVLARAAIVKVISYLDLFYLKVFTISKDLVKDSSERGRKYLDLACVARGNKPANILHILSSPSAE